MKITTQRYNPKIGYEKNKLYLLDKTSQVIFQEQQEDGSKDLVKITAQLSDNEECVFAKEYRPPHIKAQGCKNVDLMALLTNEKQQCLKSYLIDVKKDVGGEDVIFHLIDQWKDSMLHMRTLTLYYEDYAQEQCIGVITRSMDYKRIHETIQAKEEFIQECNKGAGTLSQLKIAPKLLKTQQEIETLKRFAQGQFVSLGGSQKYEVFVSEKRGDEYWYELKYRI